MYTLNAILHDISLDIQGIARSAQVLESKKAQLLKDAYESRYFKADKWNALFNFIETRHLHFIDHLFAIISSFASRNQRIVGILSRSGDPDIISKYLVIDRIIGGIKPDIQAIKANNINQMKLIRSIIASIKSYEKQHYAHFVALFKSHQRSEEDHIARISRKLKPIIEIEIEIASKRKCPQVIEACTRILREKKPQIQKVALVLLLNTTLFSIEATFLPGAIALMRNRRAPIEITLPDIHERPDHILTYEMKNVLVAPPVVHQFKSRGLKHTVTEKRGLFVLSKTKGTSALVELGFISNDEEARKLVEPKYQYKAAEGVAKGIIDYCRETKSSKQLIALSSGHGAGDPGAVNKTAIPGRTITEHEVANKVSQMAVQLLKNNGFNAIFIPSKGTTQSRRLAHTCNTANQLGASLFVEVHCNSSNNKNASGIETWYLSKKGGLLATNLQNTVLASLNH